MSGEDFKSTEGLNGQVTDAPTCRLPTRGCMLSVIVAVNMLKITRLCSLSGPTYFTFRIHVLAVFQNTHRIKQLLVVYGGGIRQHPRVDPAVTVEGNDDADRNRLMTF